MNEVAPGEGKYVSYYSLNEFQINDIRAKNIQKMPIPFDGLPLKSPKKAFNGVKQHARIFFPTKNFQFNNY